MKEMILHQKASNEEFLIMIHEHKFDDHSTFTTTYHCYDSNVSTVYTFDDKYVAREMFDGYRRLGDIPYDEVEYFDVDKEGD